MWTPAAWRHCALLEQQPAWPDMQRLHDYMERLAADPPVVTGREVQALRDAMATVAQGRLFLLQAGDCAEAFTDSPRLAARRLSHVLRDLATRLERASGRRVVLVGRVAGQFAKPRSSPVDRVGDVVLQPFRGHIVNSPEPDPAGREPDPGRMVRAYEQSVLAADELRRLPDRIWTSHEAILLPYEEALCRRDPDSGGWFAGSGHMLWVGERTRQPHSAQVEFLSGVGNPVACKVGPRATADELVAVCERLNPDNLDGRFTLIVRLGSSTVLDRLPELVEAVRSAGRRVTWVCDPMHGNTVTTRYGVRTRPVSAIIGELDAFCRVLHESGTVVGGVHLEMTPDPVTECADAGVEPYDYDPRPRFTSLMDPRLNPGQARHVIEYLAELLCAEAVQPARASGGRRPGDCGEPRPYGSENSGDR